jgi:hypothetical protein
MLLNVTVDSDNFDGRRRVQILYMRGE